MSCEECEGEDNDLSKKVCDGHNGEQQVVENKESVEKREE
jgi:hypothetical protein